MVEPCKIVEFEGEAVLLLPEDLLARWSLDVGDDLYLVETANGFTLSPSDSN